MSDDTFAGRQSYASGASEYNQIEFVVRSLLARTATATLVKVKAVGDDGFIDVQPMVAQLDGRGSAVPHGIIHNVPFLRSQGGSNAVIIDPVPGDIGIVVFGSHDLSSVKATKAPANPGSRRRFSMADALYLGGTLNGVPECYLRVSPAGIELVAPLARSSGHFAVGSGATGSFSTPSGQTVTVRDGIITGITE